LSTLLLTVAVISDVAPFWSAPSSLLASATGKVMPPGPPMPWPTIRIAEVGPAAASTAPPGLQVSGLNWAETLVATVLSRARPQMPTARLSRLARCWPRVVPGLPPTGVAGVLSLKPAPVVTENAAALAPWDRFACSIRVS